MKHSLYFPTLLLQMGLFCAMAGAQQPMSFDIPQLKKIRIDGVADDWGEQGFHVQTLVNPESEQAGTGGFHVGWDNQGLLLLVQVADNTPQETELTGGLYRMDSVELFLSDNYISGHSPVDYWDRNILQVVLSAGTTEKQTELRFHIFDYRSEHLRDIPVSIEAARQINDNGYQMEIRIP